MENVRKHLSLLGKEVEDKVTKTVGIVDSISFDLYGCIQAGVNPGLDDNKKLIGSHWYDVSRLTIIGKEPVMEAPDFDYGTVAEGGKGPASKEPMHTS
jgi:hypothetical protein